MLNTYFKKIVRFITSKVRNSQMDPIHRQRVYNFFLSIRNDIQFSRDLEAIAHSTATSETEYYDLVVRAGATMRVNPRADDPWTLIHDTDENLVKGTLLDRIESEKRMRKERFHAMLQDKFDAMNDETFSPLIFCRKCKSSELTWEEKQTRSADEPMTLFCVCMNCSNRWVMR